LTAQSDNGHPVKDGSARRGEDDATPVPVNRLAIFDIDGTLTATNQVDDDCYRQTVAEVLGVAPHAIDWTEAEHVTDSGILQWLWNAHGRPFPTGGEVAATRDRFVTRLTDALRDSPGQFKEVAGAGAALRHIERDGWRVAVATGGWGPSARLKLGAARLPVSDTVLACADDATPRVEIVRLARSRAERVHQCEFARVVALGDGAWDVKAAATLGLPFVGIGSGERADVLRRAGATVVLGDYTDLDVFTRALATAGVPRVDRMPSLAPSE